jgi:uncharacterized membrane protein (DUF485 family)
MYETNKVGRTIIIGVIWLSFITLFLAFNPAGLDIWHSAAAVIASGFIAVGAVALTWVDECC